MVEVPLREQELYAADTQVGLVNQAAASVNPGLFGSSVMGGLGSEHYGVAANVLASTMHGYAGYQEAERLRNAYLEGPKANSLGPLCPEDDNWNWWLGLAPEVRGKAVSEFRAKFEANAQPVEHTEADRIMALVRAAARG